VETPQPLLEATLYQTLEILNSSPILAEKHTGYTMQCMDTIFAAAACGTACGTLCKGLAKARQNGPAMKFRQTMYLPRQRLEQPLLNGIDQ